MKIRNWNFLVIFLASLNLTFLPVANAADITLYSENFDANSGGFSVVNTGAPQGPWTYDGSSTWFTNGSDNLGAPSHSRLNSPPINVTTTAELTLTFSHRYSFEAGLWDAGAVFLSVNGGAYTQIPNSAFSQNGYTAIGLIGNHDLNGGEGFGGDSPGYGDPTFITSIASLGSFNDGDTISVQFLGAWDEFAKGTEPNWQIDSLQITAPAPPTFNKSFSPATILTGQITSLTFTVDNSESAYDATDLSFTDNLPAAVIVATPANAATTCTGGTLTAVSGSGVISYAGGSIASASSCTLSVNVKADNAGAAVNTTGDLTSSLGNSGSASATLQVNDQQLPPNQGSTPIPTMSIYGIILTAFSLLILAARRLRQLAK